MLRATGLEEKERRLSLPHQVICHTGVGGSDVAEDGLDGHEAPLDFGR
eukprot:gene18411-13239_t